MGVNTIFAIGEVNLIRRIFRAQGRCLAVALCFQQAVIAPPVAHAWDGRLGLATNLGRGLTRPDDGGVGHLVCQFKNGIVKAEVGGIHIEVWRNRSELGGRAGGG